MEIVGIRADTVKVKSLNVKISEGEPLRFLQHFTRHDVTESNILNAAPQNVPHMSANVSSTHLEGPASLSVFSSHSQTNAQVVPTCDARAIPPSMNIQTTRHCSPQNLCKRLRR